MIFFAFLFVLVGYLAIARYLSKKVYQHLEERGKGRLLASMAAGLVKVLAIALVFWDAVPTRYTHRRLCETEAGLKVYITPEEWANKNPGAFEVVRAAAGRQQTRQSEDTARAMHGWVESTQGFVYEYFHQWTRDYAFNTGIARRKMIYKPTGEILFEEVNFYSSAGRNSLANGANSLADYKFWTVTGSCDDAYKEMKSKFTHNGQTFSDFQQQIIDWNDKERRAQ